MAGQLLSGKRIVVSGVGSGLGREVVLRCVADGASVVLASRTLSRLEEVAAEADPSGDRVATVPCDITDPDDCQALVGACVERFGGLDGVAQVAAFEYAMGTLDEADFEAWRMAYQTNVVGSMTLLRSAVPAMAAGGGGSVVLVGSQSSKVRSMDQAGYAASKGALLSAMYYLVEELGPKGITVNTVSPSWMWGPPVQGYCDWQAGERGITADEVKAEIEAKIPLGSIVPDEEVANAIGFLLSDRARMISGQNLTVNGGEYMG
jgi:NAD(P)-dependent dehydrogenase (short-subunit alcohol dehydrogenase family)